MPKGAPRTEPSLGENISHFTAVRLRATGAGDLKMKLFSFDDVNSTTLLPLTLQAANNIQPTRICNFVEQRAYLEIKTTEIDNFFKINRIIVFVKELYTGYPG